MNLRLHRLASLRVVQRDMHNTAGMGVLGYCRQFRLDRFNLVE